MSKTPFMPLWVGDFMIKTAHLDARETGAYLCLLMVMWTNGGSLPDDQKKLQRSARVGRDWPKVWQSIQHYFDAEDGRITNPRLTEELAKARAKSEVNSNAGARGGKAKALKLKEARLADATVSPKQPYPYPESESEEEKDISPLPPSGADLDLFEEAFAAWPRQEAKGRAREAWAPAIERAPPSMILSRLRMQAPEISKREPQFVPLLSTWLRDDGWLNATAARPKFKMQWDDDEDSNIARFPR